jgi:hypothetical protein
MVPVLHDRRPGRRHPAILGAWLIFSVFSAIFITVFFFRKGVKSLQESA